MGEYDSRGKLYEASQYRAFAAGSTTTFGGEGSYLERINVIPVSTGATTVTLSDGTTAIATIPAAAHAVDPLVEFRLTPVSLKPQAHGKMPSGPVGSFFSGWVEIESLVRGARSASSCPTRN